MTAAMKSSPNDSGHVRNTRWPSQNFRHSPNVSRRTRLVLASMSLAHDLLGCCGIWRTFLSAEMCPRIWSWTVLIRAVNSPCARNSRGSRTTGTIAASIQK
ncbi:MAG: hypothetical protein EBX36_01195 [Planctomycetia bacterium]|nr:hypothetical protein [Planctomycetia bacterium]